MNCLDTNALIDYLNGDEDVHSFLEKSGTVPYFAPTIVLHEVLVGAARRDGRAGVEAARANLDWIEPLPLSIDAAAEAALIKAELLDEGTRIGAMDTLIAGAVRDVGGTLVTADSHFTEVTDLDVELYR